MKKFYTAAEKSLMSALLQQHLTVAISPQCFVDPYVIDISLPDVKIAIEVDEPLLTNPERLTKCCLRDMDLKSKGWEVFRFSEDQIEKELPWVLDTILTEAKCRWQINIPNK